MKILSLFVLSLVGILMIPSVYGQENNGNGSETMGSVDLLNSKLKTGELSETLIGQVQNNLNEQVSFVKIIATFYDESGTMIGTQSAYTDPEDLSPQMKVPFEMYLEDDISSITSYDLIISWETESGSNTNTIEGLQ